MSKKPIPANGDNAIVHAAFGLEFRRERDVELIKRINAAGAEMFKRGLAGDFLQSTEVLMSSGDAGEEQAFRKNPFGGYRYRRRKAEKSRIKEIIVQGRNLFIAVDRYSRWDAVWTEVSGALNELWPAIASDENPVTALSLEYLDRFIWRGEAPFPTPKILKESIFFAKNAFDASYWHSNHGFFRESELAPFERRLDNVNLSTSGEAGDLRLDIMCQHRYIEPKKPDKLTMDVIQQSFQGAHEANREMLLDILDPSTAKMISLHKKKQ